MALRKDKIQALKDSLCLDNVDPATRSALNNLVDNLMDLFGDVALPELGGLPDISNNIDGFPEDAPFDFPLGGGGPQGFDPLDGFGGQPPAEFMGSPGGGGDGGGGDGGGGGGESPCLTIVFPAKTKTEITAAEEGSPGVGFVKIQSLQPIEEKDLDVLDKLNVWKSRDRPAGLDIKDIVPDESDFARCKSECLKEIIGMSDKEIADSQDVLDRLQQWDREGRPEQLELLKDCLKDCYSDVKFGDDEETDPIMVQNISCEKIEKDRLVIVSWDQCTNDAYVIVEACGCCE